MVLLVISLGISRNFFSKKKLNPFISSISFGSLRDGNKGGGGNSILGIGLDKAFAIFSNALSVFAFLFLFAERNVAIKN